MVDGLYSFKEGAQPVNVWCLKADYAESSGTHNTGVARLWNQVMYNAQINGEYKLRTEAQKAALAAGYKYDVRTTVDGFPCHVLYRLTADSELIYIGKYNFNNDKSTESVFGFKDIPGFDNSRMQCWELLNNGNHLALFQDMDNFDTEWDQAYEARYPDKSENVSDLKAFSEWVVSTKNDLAKFKTEKWDHLDVYKVAAYYIYLMRFGAVDQVIKNAMMTSEDGIHFYFINYDNDTVIGVRNDGLLIYNYDIDRQTIDTSFSSIVYAYAGHESTLWNNLEADEEFMQIVSEVDNALYISGLSYENTIDLFDNQQSGKWCERVYNQDAQYKYIGPYTDSGINNLYMLQGARSAHRRWWLSKRFDLLDSKYVSGAYKAKSIEFKAANAPIGLKFSVTSGNNIYYGYGLNNVPIETGIRLAPGESHTFTSKQVINIGDPCRIYSAVNVQELDVHEFAPYLSTFTISEVYNSTVGTKFKKLIMGSLTSRNTSMPAISGLSQAKRLEYLDIQGYEGITSLNLSEHEYFKKLKAYGSGLTSINLAIGAPVDLLELPDTMQALFLDSLPNITTTGLQIKNFARNVYNISIRKCDKLNTKEFIFNWNNNRVSPDNICSVIVEGISWAGINPADLISLGKIKDGGGTLTLKGVISLTSVNQAQLNEVKRIFGDSSTTPGGELYIKAPDGVFVTGPTEITEGDSAQYSASVFSDNIGTVEYYIWTGSSEVTSYNGATIDKATGFMTTTITGGNRSITVRVKHTPTQGAIVRGEMQVTVNRLIFPTSAAISGKQLLNTIGNSRYDLKINTQNVNGEYTTEWSLSGAAFDQGLVAIGEQRKGYCILNVLSTPSELAIFELKATLKKSYNNQVTATATYPIDLFIPGVIITKKSNPRVLEVCYNAGWCASPDYMTEIEAQGVSSLGTAFLGKSMTTFEELRYFTGLTELGSQCFSSCHSLTSIVIPNTVTSLGSSCFSSSTSLTSIVIPEGVTSLGISCFSSCTKLTSIVISNTVTSIGVQCFSGCTSLTDITVSNNNANYSSMGGVLLSKDKTILIACPGGKTGEYVIPNTVTSLGISCFYNCTKLTSIVIPEGVTSLDDNCFSGCTNLTSMVIPNTVTRLGGQCFRSCTNLTSIVIPNTVTSLGSSCFQYCTKLTSIVIPNTVTSLGISCFSGCASLASIVIPNTVTSLGSSCFSSCASLTSIVIPEGVTDLGSSCFYNCTKLTSIVISNTVTRLGGQCFYRCSRLTSIVIPEGVTSIGYDCFRSCTSLTSMVIPNTVTRLDDSCFSDCTSLTSIVIPNTVTSLGISCFSGCASLASITVTRGTAPQTYGTTFGNSNTTYTGRNTYNTGENILYVPTGATGYDTSAWLDPLCNAEKCGFTISYTL